MTALESVLLRMKEAAERAGRPPESIRLIAVSKLQPIEKIGDLLGQGQTDFGENYVQELTAKINLLSERAVRWHLIGHLQKNKVKFVSGRCRLIHSVDSIELAEILDRKAGENGVLENILLQVNTGGEESKEGLNPVDLLAAWPQIAALKHLRIHGLMTMPPLQNQPEANRPHFRSLRMLLERLRLLGSVHPLSELSMGTSHDFEVAIEEGATLVRVGTLLFGERPGKS